MSSIFLPPDRCHSVDISTRQSRSGKLGASYSSNREMNLFTYGLT
jgi:hypothetical protein